VPAPESEGQCKTDIVKRRTSGHRIRGAETLVTVGAFALIIVIKRTALAKSTLRSKSGGDELSMSSWSVDNPQTGSHRIS
jgi:hypothetical protein